MATLSTLKRQIGNLEVPAYVTNISTFIAQAIDICNANGFKAVNEDGTPFEAFFCGNSGRCSIRLENTEACLQVSWWGDKEHGVNGNKELAMYVM